MASPVVGHLEPEGVAVAIRYMLRLLLLTGAIAFLVAPPTQAQDRGVTIDPGSPAAREYAFPFPQARRDAGVVPRRNGVLPPFGEGISRAVSAARPDGQPALASGLHVAGGKRSRSARDEAATKRRPSPLSSAAPEASLASSDASTASLVVLVVAVLLGGLALGIAIRWLSRVRS